MLRLSFESPKLGVADEVKNLLKKSPKPKKEPQFWTLKERIIVGSILTFTILLSIYFWYQGQGKLPNINFPEVGGFSLQGTVEVR